MKVASVDRFNKDANIDLDIVSLCRMMAPKNILSSGAGTTNADKALATENGLIFAKDITIKSFVDLVKRDPSALIQINPVLAEAEKQFARVIKNRSPLKINPKAYRNYLEDRSRKRDVLISKWQQLFSADIGQKTDDVRIEIGDKFGIDPKRISKESVATSDMSINNKNDVFEIMEIFNIQQEISNLGKLEGRKEYAYSFIPFGSVSGRSSTFGENIHGMTKEQFGIFTKKENGMRLVSIDFSQIELRLAAALWGDLPMQSVFNAGGDIHLNTAKLIGGSDRQLAKALNFGLLYGMGVESFLIYCAKDFGIILTHEEAERYVAEFKRSYPSLFNKNVTEFTGLSYKTKTLGREMHAQEVRYGSYDIKKYTIARNIQIQGEGVDIMKATIPVLEKMLKGIGSVSFEIFDECGFWIQDNSDMRVRINSICDELTQHIREISGFTIPIQLNDRF